MISRKEDVMAFRRAGQWFASSMLLFIAMAASSQGSGPQIGRELAIPRHLQDGEEFNCAY